MNMKKRFTKAGWLLLAAGAAMLAVSMLQLYTGPKLLEYAVCAPELQRVELPVSESGGAPQFYMDTGLEAMWEARALAMEQLGDGVSQMACAGLRTGTAVSAGNEKSAEASLHAVDLCYLETCPRWVVEGRWMDNTELEQGRPVAVLNAELAFALFGSENAIGEKLEIAGGEYSVIGIAAHSRSVGEPGEYGAYIPMRAADAQGLQLDTLTMYALPIATQGMDQSFIAAMEPLWGEGTFYNLDKQVMGATMLPRLMLFAFGMAAVLWLLKRLRSLVSHFAVRIRELHSHMYLPRLLPHALWRFAVAILCAAGLLAVTYGLFCFAIEPVYTFTEWVPESLVELSAIRKVFWNLVQTAARPVTVQTANAARVAFWGGFARWGTILVLLALALRRKSEKKLQKPVA